MAQCNASCPNSSHDNPRDVPNWPVQPDYDISGLGVGLHSTWYYQRNFAERLILKFQVLISFMATAYFTVVLIIIQYFLDYFEAPYLNKIDRGLVTYVRRKLRLKSTGVWAPTIRKGIMMISDQQLITGIAVLAGAYSQLRCGKISAYHWQLIVYLAWFSSLTHLTTLTVLRQYFREHPTLRAWRVSLMLIVALLLAVALLPTGRIDWLSIDSGTFAGGVPASCAFRDLGPDKYEPHSTSTMAMSLFVLFTSYTSRIVKLFPHADAFAQTWLRTKPGGIMKRALDRLRKRGDSEGAARVWRLAHLLLLSLYLVFRATFEIFGSMLWEVCFIYSTLVIRSSSQCIDHLAHSCASLGYQPFIGGSRKRPPEQKWLGLWTVGTSFDVDIAAA